LVGWEINLDRVTLNQTMGVSIASWWSPLITAAMWPSSAPVVLRSFGEESPLIS
jgi:hypothetical protein